MHTFELFLLKENLTQQDWQKLTYSIAKFIGFFRRFRIIFSIRDNVVRIFIQTPKDVGVLSNNLEGILLRNVVRADHEQYAPPDRASALHFMRLVTGGNILDLREKYQVKRNHNLELAIFTIRSFNTQKHAVVGKFYFKRHDTVYRATRYFFALPYHLFSMDFSKNTRYLKRKIGKYLNIEKSLHILTSESNNALFVANTFPYLPRPYFLGLNSYEFERHSFIIGASGSGKSKFISLFVDRLQKNARRDQYRVIVIDPHASLVEDFSHIPKHTIINFHKDEGTELFPGAGADLTAAVELTATLFKSLLADQFNSRLDRLLRFTLFVLFTAQNMSLDTLKRFMTDIELRNQIIQHVTGYVPENIIKFFGTDFNEIRTKYYNEAITPIISLVDEMQLQPSLVGKAEVSLAKTVADNFLTVFSLNKVSMGDKVVKTVAGLLIQQIFLLAQARAFKEKVILIIDEVSVVQNPAIASILAEARKFNLSIVLTQQYFGQIQKDLQDAIFANVFNYYAFKVSEEDARALEGNLSMELPKEIVKEEQEKGLNETEIRLKLMTERHPRECLVRVAAGGQLVPCIIARTVDAPQTDETSRKKPRVNLPQSSSLPKKFEEGQTKKTSPLPQSRDEAIPKNLAQEKTQETAPALPTTPQSDKSDIIERRWGYSLSELLSQQSSSTDKSKK